MKEFREVTGLGNKLHSGRIEDVVLEKGRDVRLVNPEGDQVDQPTASPDITEISLGDLFGGVNPFRIPDRDIRFSLDQDDDLVRSASLVLSEKVLNGVSVSEKDAARLVPDADEQVLERVVKNATGIAAAVEARLEDYKNDEEIVRALRNEEIEQHYRNVVEMVSQQGELRGEYLQKARSQIKSRKTRATKNRAKAVNGLTVGQMDSGEGSLLDEFDEVYIGDKLEKKKETTEDTEGAENGDGDENVELENVPKSRVRKEGRKEEDSVGASAWVKRVKAATVDELYRRDEIKNKSEKTQRSAIVREAFKKSLVNAFLI